MGKIPAAKPGGAGGVTRGCSESTVEGKNSEDVGLPDPGEMTCLGGLFEYFLQLSHFVHGTDRFIPGL